MENLKEIMQKRRKMKKAADRITMEVLQSVANEIHEMIQLTIDFPSNYPEKRMPILDMKVWIGSDSNIQYIFYEKPMRSNLVVGKNSALPEAMKMRTLTQEAYRRIHNTRLNLHVDCLPDILTTFMQKLKDSGYSEKERFNILQGGFKTHENIMRLVNQGKRDYFRTPETRKIARERSKESSHKWFRKSKKDMSVASVMFVEPTPGGELLKQLKEIEEVYKIDEGKRIKFVEKSGKKIIDKIRVSDPFRSNCKEQECLACRNSEKFSNCRKTNIGYQITCKLCKSRGKNRIYQGESSRNLYLRGREHLNQLKNEKSNSVMLKHNMNEHENELERVEYEMKITGSFRKPLGRIIDEGLRIKHTKKEELLNSKNEFFGPSVKRRTLK